VLPFTASMSTGTKLIEGVRRRFTKLVPLKKEAAHDLRWRRLKLDTLKFRKTGCDLIQTFKIIKGYDH